MSAKVGASWIRAAAGVAQTSFCDVCECWCLREPCRSRGQIGRATPAQQSHERRHAHRHTRAMNMTSKKPLHTVPVPSTRFTTEAYFDGQGSSPAIRFGYGKDGTKHQGGIKFNHVLAVRTRSERCCTAWHIDGAYDTLVEIEGSSWVEEMRADTAEQWKNKWPMHHYMIYLDSAGCFEVIADSWEPL